MSAVQVVGQKTLMTVTPAKCLEALLALPHVVEVDPGKGFSKAALNLHNGMVVEMPRSGGGFSMWGNSGSSSQLKDCLVIAEPRPAEPASKGDEAKPRLLAGDDLDALRRTWTAQAALLDGVP